MLIVECPHCSVSIEIEQINCRVFRCGFFKISKECINPHSSKEECDKYVRENQIYGCGKPFYLNEDNTTVKCDYI